MQYFLCATSSTLALIQLQKAAWTSDEKSQTYPLKAMKGSNEARLHYRSDKVTIERNEVICEYISKKLTQKFSPHSVYPIPSVGYAGSRPTTIKFEEWYLVFVPPHKEELNLFNLSVFLSQKAAPTVSFV
ncbi:uncharacterized protein PHALS_13072 [Plasmopara halstedii]|uniref:Uncharacterized protein n=1 Tax=Plasmopara halstedii TaxID=4781 RepID=A0A0P1APT0_PLAHL|nr:uncharacterized protein PHALS_13072 [Plasmopara halstedii]CEG42829.1 hypothetical protein PHALS_13072 [Plasmopara halstedii]|eukprot:XP_024579198.1 hypothetical protein PHALS_13072 [Plasmopara halstedii]